MLRLTSSTLKQGLGLFPILLILSCINSCKSIRYSNNIIIASAGKITSLDPAQANSFHSLQLLSALGDTLYRLRSDGSLEPRLAKDLPRTSSNGLNILIPLREDVLFHDGTKFDADAMVFSIKRFMKIGTLNYILGGRIKSITAEGKYLLKIILNRPSTSLNGLLTSINLTPVSPKAYTNHKEKFLNKKFVGTGPYKLKSFDYQQKRLERFDFYWSDKAKNIGVDFINLSNSTALLIALKNKEIDVLLSSAIDLGHQMKLNNMAKNNHINEGKGSALEIGYITFRTNSPPLDRTLLRQALMYSLNRPLIVKRVSFGLRKPLRSLVPSSLHGQVNAPWPKYNPGKARKLFKQLGYCEKKKLTLPFTIRSNIPADKLLALTWQAQIDKDLSDCFLLKINAVESTTVYQQLGKGAYESVMLDWRGAYPDPEAYIAPLLSCEKLIGNNCLEGEAAISGSFWSTAWLNKSLKLNDQLKGQERIKRLKAIEEYVVKGGAYLPVWIVTPKAWTQKNLSEPVFDGNGQLLIDQLVRKE